MRWQSSICKGCYKLAMSKQKLLELIKTAIWEQGIIDVDEDVYIEMKQHAITVLPANILSTLKMSDDLRESWQDDVLQHVSYYAKYKYAQNRVPISVPYVILKGTSAAQYYPHPEYRTMGDIDIMSRREDFESAYRDLEENGYKVTKTLEREVTFEKNGIEIELHRYFASLNDPTACKYLDDLIIENINPSHILPDFINGVVLLEHISQHLEHGLGLRQIIDWMMFVDKCLPDDKWPEFRPMAKAIGLEQLAITTTRMCELYIGLSKRLWCANADEVLCKELMELILSSGNFGNKWTSDEAVAKTVFTYIRGPLATFKWLQESGLKNWKAAQVFPVLRPFAWIYQGIRYAIRGITQEGSISKLREEYEDSVKRTELFNALGVKQKANGLVTYRDGRYVKR